MAEVICETIGISKRYKNNEVLKDVSLKIKRGEILGLIGENGAGKTTLIRILSGLVIPTNGEVKLFGESNEKKLSEARKKVGAIIEGPALYDEMTAKENLQMQRIQRGIPNDTIIDEVLSIVNLNETGKKRVKNFSLGMKQRLALAISLIGEPEILILDEPLNGLDPIGIKELRELLIKLNKEEGMTIIISSHILSELNNLATTYGIIHEGKLIEEITSKELDIKCKKHILLRIDNIKKAVCILENSLKIKNYIVTPDNEIKIYESLDKSMEINRELAINNIYSKEITLKGDTLEAYYSNVIGGGKNV